MKNQSIWISGGSDKDFEYYRNSTSERSKVLRDWVDQAYYKNDLMRYLDKDFVRKLKNNDFFARLWELELAKWLQLLKFELTPTEGIGPDFCFELSSGKKVWIEAVLSRASEQMEKTWRDNIDAGEYDTKCQETALRYTSSLFDKAKIIENSYLKMKISRDDYILIAVSAFKPGSMDSDIDFFMRSILPIEDQVIHFSIDGSPLDENISRPTHIISREYVKKSGKKVEKEFLYPGTLFPFINGVIFSEASNLQRLLGTESSRFDESTNYPHLFSNYSGKKLPKELTKQFYFHEFTDYGQIIKLEMNDPESGVTRQRGILPEAM